MESSKFMKIQKYNTNSSIYTRTYKNRCKKCIGCYLQFNTFLRCNRCIECTNKNRKHSCVLKICRGEPKNRFDYLVSTVNIINEIESYLQY